MRHTFQSFWVGDDLSPYEALCMRSFIDHGHRVALYCYSNRLQVPRGVELRDAAAILPKEQCFAYSGGFGKGSFSACSNLFRYLLLERLGGWWIDTDVICLSERIPHCHSFFAREDPDFINGAVLYFEAGDRLMVECLRDALRLGRNVAWGEIGPRLITRKAAELNRDWEARPSSSCYPVHWSNALDLLDPRKCDAIACAASNSVMLHLWNEIFRQSDISKYHMPPQGSYLHMLTEKHSVGGWRGQYALKDASEENIALAIGKITTAPMGERLMRLASSAVVRAFG
ncbi:glycosyltransferase [Hyphomicrobium sp. D-2]|uniref:glycosyltransferase n=1 Tax=Hyphomicrobium sp. D-2 TaxID=3041621 RepID=UPI00245507FA|nr:glycosyltransferase [Hyphomicrobium sp. D-2]MDH4981183.1 glycosyltransferase [Hyphomicrobium sp. D-2]